MKINKIEPTNCTTHTKYDRMMFPKADRKHESHDESAAPAAVDATVDISFVTFKFVVQFYDTQL